MALPWLISIPLRYIHIVVGVLFFLLTSHSCLSQIHLGPDAGPTIPSHFDHNSTTESSQPIDTYQYPYTILQSNQHSQGKPGENRGQTSSSKNLSVDSSKKGPKGNSLVDQSTLSHPIPAWAMDEPTIFPRKSETRTTSVRPQVHIGAVFPMTEFNNYHQIFIKTLDEINSQSRATFTFTNVSIATVDSVHYQLQYMCLAMQEFNMSSILIIGNQDTINVLSIITQYAGIPVLGYNTNHKSIAIRGSRPLYFQLDPSKAIQARAIVHALKYNHWHCAAIITEDTYANDGFIDAFRSLTKDPVWEIEDTIVLHRNDGTSAIDSLLLDLLENKSRVLILHCSIHVARIVFLVAQQQHYQITSIGYAWFVTEDVVIKSSRILKEYPLGLLGVVMDKSYNQETAISDATQLVAKATIDFVKDHGRSSFKKSCKEFRHPNDDSTRMGDLFYRYLKNTTYEGENNIISFDEDGVLKDATFKIVNLVNQSDIGKPRWKQVGTYKNGTVKLSTIIWPGGGVSGPTGIGERTLRVVTNVVEPFVMEQYAVNEKCITASPCLSVQTKETNMLDDIFKDYAHNVHNESRPYEVHCCQGFSIKLLERFALDMNFTFQLYVTADRKYGNIVNGSWNGLVQDLTVGAAHMAVAALSITQSRSRVIDFTDPYFFSGFSILVSERKRSPPIYAFMEPFDSWVWISIVMSATVVAVALSLLEWNSPFGLNPWGRKRRSNYTLGSGLNMVWAIMFQHTIKTKSPKAWPSKWLQNYWAGASIFIYSSYTANLAAFLAGKNSGVIIDGIHDPKLHDLRTGYLASSSIDTFLKQFHPRIHGAANHSISDSRIGVKFVMYVRLLEPGRHIGIINGMAVEDYVRQVNWQLLRKSTRYEHTLSLPSAIELLRNETIDAYIDDTPILEYARTSMDTRCQLRLVGKGFGEDSYGVAVPKHSWLRKPLSKKIREYHESGFLEELHDLYFRRSRCVGQTDEGQLQGEASSMTFAQHAGLYLLLVVGIVVCILLMFLEHALFKWMVPYWRQKPPKSFWRSLSMLFWSQRLYRIITSEELVSPHHSAREMMQVVKNRDFTKLFQKSVKKQDKNIFNSKNLFRVVEQLQLKTRRDERLSQNPSTVTEGSMDSEYTPTPTIAAAWNRSPRSVPGLQSLEYDGPATSDANKDSLDDTGLACRPKVLPISAKRSDLSLPSKKKTKPSLKEAHASSIFSEPVIHVEKPPVTDSDTQDQSKSDDELLEPDLDPPLARGSSVRSVGSSYTPLKQSNSDPRDQYPLKTCDISTDESDRERQFVDLDESDHERRYSNPNFPLLGRASSSEDNLLSSFAGPSLTDFMLPNGIVILAPNGDIFTRSASSGKNVLVRPKAFANLKNITPNLPDSFKTLPLKDNRVKSRLAGKRSGLNSSTFGDDAVNNDLVQKNLDNLTKEDLFLMWRTSEEALSSRLAKALKEKAELEKKLMDIKPNSNT